MQPVPNIIYPPHPSICQGSPKAGPAGPIAWPVNEADRETQPTGYTQRPPQRGPSAQRRMGDPNERPPMAGKETAMITKDQEPATKEARKDAALATASMNLTIYMEAITKSINEEISLVARGHVCLAEKLVGDLRGLADLMPMTVARSHHGNFDDVRGTMTGANRISRTFERAGTALAKVRPQAAAEFTTESMWVIDAGRAFAEDWGREALNFVGKTEMQNRAARLEGDGAAATDHLVGLMTTNYENEGWKKDEHHVIELTAMSAIDAAARAGDQARAEVYRMMIRMIRAAQDPALFYEPGPGEISDAVQAWHQSRNGSDTIATN